MKLIIEQDEDFAEIEEIIHGHCCEPQGGECTCSDPYITGPCFICGSQFFQSTRQSFTVGIEGCPDPEILKTAWTMCCAQCARLSLAEIHETVTEQCSSFEFEARFLRDRIQLILGLTGLETLYDYLWGRWLNANARAQSLGFVLRSYELERRFVTQATGYVYLLASPDGYCKIGRAKNLNARLKQIGLQLPYKVELIHSIPVVNPIKAERAMHLKFADQRMNGEWFNLSTEDIEWFKGQSAIRETQGV